MFRIPGLNELHPSYPKFVTFIPCQLYLQQDNNLTRASFGNRITAFVDSRYNDCEAIVHQRTLNA